MANVDEIRKVAIRLGERVRNWKKRYVYSEIASRLRKEPRIKLIRGFRGSGKTTLMLQIFNENREKAIYFSADSPLLAGTSLYDLIKEFISHGKEIILIDEIHKYPDWRKDVKAIYDEYSEVTLVCSGSAPLALIPERREEVFDVDPMNFKEFLELKYGIMLAAVDEWKDEEKSVEIIAKYSPRIEQLFREYYQVGGYPISISYDLESSKKAIFNSIRKSIYEDTISILKMSQEKAFAMHRLLTFLATSLPGELSINKISSLIEMSKSSIYEILDALEKMKIIRIIHPKGKGSKLVRGPHKILFYHPNLRYAICNELGVEPDIGAIREELAVFFLSRLGMKVMTIKGMKRSPDYYVSPINTVIEIGGKGKSRAQLKGFKKGILLKPDQLMVLGLSIKSKNRPN